ncbi:MAG: hypothetical protein CM15mP103_04800 [Gammaproteobacteria bacterium]|nr:MAG: hypothetical protein CM15mP103_04800 [Gammaproteobacteria bacterium]
MSVDFRVPGLRRFNGSTLRHDRRPRLLHDPTGQFADRVRAGQGRLDAGLGSSARIPTARNLSVKPNPVKGRDGCVQLGVDVYGGALLNPGLIAISP